MPQTTKLADAGHALSMTAGCHHNAPVLHAEQQLRTAMFSYTCMMTGMPYGSTHAGMCGTSNSDFHRCCPSCHIKVGAIAGAEEPHCDVEMCMAYLGRTGHSHSHCPAGDMTRPPALSCTISCSAGPAYQPKSRPWVHMSSMCLQVHGQQSPPSAKQVLEVSVQLLSSAHVVAAARVIMPKLRAKGIVDEQAPAHPQMTHADAAPAIADISAKSILTSADHPVADEGLCCR